MRTAPDFQQYADDSADHRDPTDPEVAATIHEIQKWAEVERLDHEDRLP